MSSALALAGVTYVLRDLLNDGLINSTLDTNVRVTARPPARDPSAATVQESQLNLFLYQVSPNTGWRNASLPSRDFGSARITNPPLALDLHYLVTAYDERDYHAEVLLGYAMQLLHENPGLSREQIRKSLQSDIESETEPQLPANLKRLTQTGLADQFESLKIAPRYLNTEEMSKLWTGFQAPYRPSMAYEVSVVLIEREDSVPSPRPVQTRNLQLAPFAFPVLDEVSPLRASEGETLVLRGVNLSQHGLSVAFGSIQVAPAKTASNRLEVAVPTGLRAGVNVVSVKRDIEFGVTASDPHGGIESNSLAFLLIPNITPADGGEAFTASPGSTLRIAVNPKVAADQKVQLLIGEKVSVALAARESDSEPLAELEFAIPADLVVGQKYLLRLRVDGADSALNWESDPAQPAQGEFTGPWLEIV